MFPMMLQFIVLALSVMLTADVLIWLASYSNAEGNQKEMVL